MLSAVAAILLASTCHEFALMHADAALYPKPMPRAQLPVGSKECQPSSPVAPTLFVARVLGQRGDFYEVETLGPVTPSIHCWRDDDAPRVERSLRKYRLHLFVEAKDLQPVTRHLIDLTYPDETRIRMRPGVPVTVHALPDGGVEASDFSDQQADRDLFSFRFVLPPDAVGPTYSPADWPFGSTTDQWPGDAGSGPDGYVVVGRPKLRIGAASVIQPRFESFVPKRGKEASRERIVSFEAECVAGRARGSRRAIHRVQDGAIGGVEGGTEGGSFCGVLDGPPVWIAEAGAHVYWPDGTRAGSLLEDDELLGPETKNGDGHLCFQVQLGAAPNALTLCFEKPDVHLASECQDR